MENTKRQLHKAKRLSIKVKFLPQVFTIRIVFHSPTNRHVNIKDSFMSRVFLS